MYQTSQQVGYKTDVVSVALKVTKLHILSTFLR